MEKQLQEAIQVIKKGGIVIFPTDTAFGIGCRIDNHTTIVRLFTLRNRPLTKPTPVLVSDLEMVQQYSQDLDPEVEERLIKKYWPGALTIILPAKPEVDFLVQRDGGIGLRMPNHNITLELIKKVGVGILAPSANFHGKPTPFRLEDLDPELVKKVDYVLEGESKMSRESTVISCLKKPWTIIRQGAIEISL